MPKCEDCGREFSTESALAQHMRDKHGLETSPAQGARGGAESPRTLKKQKSLRKRNRHPAAIALVAVAVAAGIGIYFLAAPSIAAPPFDCIAEQNYYIHLHPYLQILIENASVSIPANVGIVQNGGCLEPIHTHDSSGILHVELSQAESGRNWTLGDFFTIWKYTCGVESSECPAVNGTYRPVIFNQTDILGFRADSTHKVELLINGTRSSAWGSLNLEQYAYCTLSRANVAPCSPTAGGDPAWQCASTSQCGTYPYKTGYELVIRYVATG